MNAVTPQALSAPATPTGAQRSIGDILVSIGRLTTWLRRSNSPWG